MSLRMRALRSFTLRGNKVGAFDIFKVKDADAPALAAVGMAELVTDDEAEKEAGAIKAPARKPAANSAAKPKAQAPKEGKPVSAMTVAELRDQAGKLGLGTHGLKAELVARIGRYNRRDMRAR